MDKTWRYDRAIMALFQINYKGKNFRKMDKSLEIISQEKKKELFCALQIHNFWRLLTMAAIL